MEPVYVFLIRNDVWIYILCGMGLFWFGSEYLRSQRILRQAFFGLEWEKGRRLRNNSLGFIIFFSAIIGFVYYTNIEIAPDIPDEVLNPVILPTPDIFRTPLASPTPLEGMQATAVPSPTAPLVPTITLAGGPDTSIPSAQTTPPAAVPTPNVTITPFIDCTPTLNIREPRDGSVVSGAISFNGTAATPALAAYRLDANGPQTSGQWSSLLGRQIERSVEDGLLGSVNLSEWAPGPYLIRLTAVDTAGTETGICVIQITLDG